MCVLTIPYEDFRMNPGLLFNEMRVRGCVGCVTDRGQKYVVRLEIEDAADDSVYNVKNDQDA
jgi:hypothetical protein